MLVIDYKKIEECKKRKQQEEFQRVFMDYMKLTMSLYDNDNAITTKMKEYIK